MKKIIILSVIIIILLSIAYAMGYTIPKTALIGRLLHALTENEKVKDHILIEDFNFWEVNYTRTFTINPKYIDIYELGFISQNDQLTSKYHFTGKVQMEIFSKNTLLYQKEITDYESISYKKNDLSVIKQVSLAHFEVPLRGRLRDLRLVLKVAVPDTSLRLNKDSIKLYIAVSPMP